VTYTRNCRGIPLGYFEGSLRIRAFREQPDGSEGIELTSWRERVQRWE
jgi:hypothetical protein